jgi:hypothetical protein
MERLARDKHSSLFDRWTDSWTDEQMNRWTDEQTDEQIEQMDKQTNKQKALMLKRFLPVFCHT